MCPEFLGKFPDFSVSRFLGSEKSGKRASYKKQATNRFGIHDLQLATERVRVVGGWRDFSRTDLILILLLTRTLPSG